MSERREELIPALGVVTEIRKDTPDVKTFRVVTPDGKKAFEHKPGQCAMLSVPGVGEGMFSITSSPTQEEYMEFSIKKCGCLTSWLHAIEPGQMITIRGPYGNGFPVDTELKGKNLLFIAGGIGLAPLHSVINYCRHYRDQYGDIDIIYGSRSMDDLVDIKEIQDEWCNEEGINVHLTIDRPQEGWDGHVGFVPSYVNELNLSLDNPDLWTADHDQVYSAESAGTGLLKEPGIYNHGASHEVRYRKVRPLQYRFQVCLQGRSGIPLRPAG